MPLEIKKFGDVEIIFNDADTSNTEDTMMIEFNEEFRFINSTDADQLINHLNEQFNLHYKKIEE